MTRREHLRLRRSKISVKDSPPFGRRATEPPAPPQGRPMPRLLLPAACAALAAAGPLHADNPPKPAALPPPVVTPAADAPTPPDLVRQAVELFKQGDRNPLKYAEAAKLFARAMNSRVELTQGQVAAWAYCRVRLAAERLNAAKGDPAVAAAVAAEVEDAMKLAPDHARLQQFGRDVLAAAGGGKPRRSPDAPASPAGDGWQALELGSFRVRYAGNRELAEAVAKKAEEHRAAIF